MKKLCLVVAAVLVLACGGQPKAADPTPDQLVERAMAAPNARILEGILAKIPPGTPGRSGVERRLLTMREEEALAAQTAAEAKAMDDRLIEKGQALQAKLAKGHPMMRPGVGGELMRYAVASVSVPMRAWENLSDEERISLALFARSTIPEVRRNPDRYLAEIGIPASAPVYDRLRTNIAGVCNDCFEVMLVTVKSRTTVTLERRAIMGDSAWSLNPHDHGEKWSDVEKRFRASLRDSAPKE